VKTIIEPFRIKSVEPLRLTSQEERKAHLAAAHYNLFALDSDAVLIDLLTDSGTSAMSARQWAAIMVGDESYAGSPSFNRFEAAVKNLMPFRHVIPTHQGRAAEAILFHLIGGPGLKIPSNTHFDTTRGNIEATGAEAIDLPAPEGLDRRPAPRRSTFRRPRVSTRRRCVRSRAISTSPASRLSWRNMATRFPA